MEFDVSHQKSNSHNNNVDHTEAKKKMSYVDENAHLRSSNEFSSVNTASPNGKETADKQLTEEEIKKQTRKIMEAFLQGVIERHDATGNLQESTQHRTEPKRTVSAPLSESLKTVITPRPNTSEGNVRSFRPHPGHVYRKPLRKESNDEILQKVMKGKKPDTLHHKPTLSVGSTDSGESTPLKTGRFHRSKSFSKAQRHSVVTDLENKATVADSRRSSVDVPQSSQITRLSIDDNTSRSPTNHVHARSDPVSMNYITAPKINSEDCKEKEEKKKTSFWKKWKSKRKEGRKSKEDLKEPSSVYEIVSTDSRPQKKKNGSAVNERHGISREDAKQLSSTSPSPPQSPKPKRTPNLIRRLSAKKKKVSKSSIQEFSIQNAAGRSHSLDFDEIDTISQSEDSKSNSLPTSVRLTTKPPRMTRQQHLAENSSRLKEEKGNDATKQLQRSQNVSGVEGNLTRPNTLDISKKKTSTFKKIRKALNIDSSSSSDDDFVESLQSVSKYKDIDVKKKNSLPSERKSSSGQIKQAHSDKKPENNIIRERYQHRSSKSMGDMDPLDKSCSQIAQKLRRVAEQYGHLVAQHYHGPSGRTQTPDSYRHELQSQSKNSRIPGHGPPVNRATSLTTGRIGSGEEISSHSLKAYYNLQPSRQRMKINDESRESNSHRRFTRKHISHKPTGSLDSPISEHQGKGWKERTAHELHHEKHSGYTKKDRTVTETFHFQQKTSMSSLSPPPSQSPVLRTSMIHTRRQCYDTVDSSSPHSNSYIQLRQEFNGDDESDDVELDALPYNEDASQGRPPTPDFSSGFLVASDSVVVEDVVERYEERIVTTHGHTSQSDDLDDFCAVPAQSNATTIVDQSDVQDPGGAVGGGDLPQDIDEDKLVQRLVEALIKRGEKYASEVDTNQPALDDALIRTIRELSFERIKNVLTQAFSFLTEMSTSSSFRHPEIVKIAVMFNMADLVMRASTKSYFERLLQSFIDPIVQRIGGWGRVENDLEETERDLTTMEDEEPCTSGLTNHHGVRKSSETDDELD